jgi:mRNA interferase MazF
MNTEPDLRRGAIYWVDWHPARGTEQRRRRPALVVQADPINASPSYANTIVVALTTADHGVPTHVAIEPSSGNGLMHRSFAMCEQIMTITRDRLATHVGSVDESSLARVDRALKRALGLL